MSNFYVFTRIYDMETICICVVGVLCVNYIPFSYRYLHMNILISIVAYITFICSYIFSTICAIVSRIDNNWISILFVSNVNFRRIQMYGAHTNIYHTCRPVYIFPLG